jgi:peptide/nickel transport system substrate-binding protein
MFNWKAVFRISSLALLLLLLACREEASDTAVTPLPPTPIPVLPTEAPPTLDLNRNFIVVATDAPNEPYTLFDPFGDVDGFDSRLLENIAVEAGLEYELVVTPVEGVLNSIAAQPGRDFDALIANLAVPETAPEGIAYTDPYLEVGQVVVVLVDNLEIQSAGGLRDGALVGVRRDSLAQDAALQVIGIAEDNLQNHHETGVQALQALIDEAVDAVIVDSVTAEYFATTFPNQLKIVGGNGRDAWITERAYAIALSDQDTVLLERLNRAIAAVHESGSVDRLTVAWLVPTDSLQPGESRTPAPANELTIGMVGNLADLDPAAAPDLISWELKINTMSGLYALTTDNTFTPMLAAGSPIISEDGLQYTIPLQRGLRFSDGSELTADDVKWSIDRSRSLGSFFVNSVLKDADGDNFADDDAVQIVDPYTVRFVLQEPNGQFLSYLATPPYFPISSECYAAAFDLQSTCGGIGPYSIVSWEPGERIRLRANPEWPGRPAPVFENILVRFYEDGAALRRSLEQFRSIDLAWAGLSYDDFTALQTVDSDGDGRADFLPWTGAPVFKSYLRFNHAAAPWDSANVRRAAAYAIDREALAATVFNNSRDPLFTPLPATVPGSSNTFPARDLAQAQGLLLEEGFSANNPIAVELWYESSGRYSVVEAAYAEALKAQLEETGVFQVTVRGAPFEQYSFQVSECGYPTYLFGWPTPGQPVSSLDAAAWAEFLAVSNAFCANYDNEAMVELWNEIVTAVDPLAREALILEMQTLWAEELPTLPLLQAPRFAISQSNVRDFQTDGLGLLHYELLGK